MDDLISRQTAIDALRRAEALTRAFGYHYVIDTVRELPSAQPEPSDAYMKAVWTWLIDYQVKAAELQGRYTPYEVLGWVANDWRKEHGQTD